MFVEGGKERGIWPKHANAIKKEKGGGEGGGGVQWLDGDRAALCLTATLALSPTAVAQGKGGRAVAVAAMFCCPRVPQRLVFFSNISEKSLRGHRVAFARAARTPILLGAEGNCGAHSRVQPSVQSFLAVPLFPR